MPPQLWRVTAVTPLNPAAADLWYLRNWSPRGCARQGLYRLDINQLLRFGIDFLALKPVLAPSPVLTRRLRNEDTVLVGVVGKKETRRWRQEQLQ